jgi:type IV pilus assembly protein PilY1
MKIRIPAFVVAAMLCLGLGSREARADDIDIFTNNGGGAAGTPTVMFLFQNTSSWSDTSQYGSKNPTQGQNELQAIMNVLSTFNFKSSINIGVAEYVNPNESVNGAYVRFAARDMSVATNRTALSTILQEIYNNVGDSNEKTGDSQPDLSEGFYEIYKYYKGLPAYAGPAGPNPPTQKNPVTLADWASNPNVKSGSIILDTAAGVGMTSGFALDSATGLTYQTPLSGCGRTFIIFISNNQNGGSVSKFGGGGSQTYQTTTAGTLPDVNGFDPFWIDEWAQYLNKNLGTITYVLDDFNPGAGHNQPLFTAVLQNTATVGGGKYFQASDTTGITKDLNQILSEIQAINSDFSSVSLPVSATNRAQDLNQVFIGLFRPDLYANPRWLGNLKQYKLGIDTAGNVSIVDSNGSNAINSSTGFITSCSASYWTTDSSGAVPPSGGKPYWTDVTDSPTPASGCPTASMPIPSNPGLPSGLTAPDPYSDYPDGPTVEKGGVAEVIRRGNNPSATTVAGPSWAVNRNLLTLSSSSTVTGLTTTNSGLSSAVVNWISGQDNDASTINPGPEKASDTGTYATDVRPSVHGDVIHSRPEPVNYGGTTGVTVYYGANDGTLRAVDGASGTEKWAFVAPEFYSRFQRLYDNSPQVLYPGTNYGSTAPAKKDYFFDGLIGLYEKFDSSNNASTVWLYPSMRRGGRMLYAFDVSTPGSNPTFKWKFGCPDLTDDNNCSDGNGTTKPTGIGQTWSYPHVAFLAGYNSGTTPVIIMGGGYDTCEDANTASPSCSSPKGAVVYVIDGSTGQLITSFSMAGMHSVAADVQFLSLTNDGNQSFAYVADTEGSIYRIDFVDSSLNALAPSNWVMHQVAYTTGGGRKFLFGPATLASFGGQAAFVAIGSGDREHPLASEYPYTAPVHNRFYVFVDDLTTTSRAAVNLDNTDSTTNLYMADLTGETCTTVAACQTSQALTFNTNITKLQAGWYVNLQAGTGEQVVNGVVIAGGQALFSTNYPTPPSSTSCVNNLGSAQAYAFNVFNGFNANGPQNYSTLVGGGLPATPVVATVTFANGVTKTVVIGGGPGCTSQFCSPQLSPVTNPKRRIIYWRSSGDNK